MAKNTTAAKGGTKAATKKAATGSGKNGSGESEKKSGNANGSSKNGETSGGGLKGLIENITHPFRTQKTLDDLFEAGLNDVYSAEKQLIEALPLMEKAAESNRLKKAFAKHLKQTERQAERLEKIFEKMKMGKTGETCKAMEGLVKESNKVISEFESGPVCDSALIMAAQKVEHYEIASYGSLAELSDVLGYSRASNLLGVTLEEEKVTDELLTEIAMEINDDAFELSEKEKED